MRAPPLTLRPDTLREFPSKELVTSSVNLARSLKKLNKEIGFQFMICRRHIEEREQKHKCDKKMFSYDQTSQSCSYFVQQYCHYKKCKLGGSWFVLIVSQSRVSILKLSKSESQQLRKSWHFQKVGLKGWAILIEISWFSHDINVRDLLRFIKIYQNSQFFLDLDWEITLFFKYLDQELTCFFIYLARDIYFNCRNMWKVVRESQGKLRKDKEKPSLTTFHRCLKSKIYW